MKNAMIASVLKYKGFYIARYEAGLDKSIWMSPRMDIRGTLYYI